MILASLTTLSLFLAWTPNPEPDVIGYRVYESDNRIGWTTRTVFPVQVARGQEYEWAVTAVDAAANESSRSLPVRFSRPLVLHLPLATVREGVTSCKDGGTLYVTAGRTSETLRIRKPMKIKALGGPVRIGGVRWTP